MSGTRESNTTDGIELHFCRDCGISIPIADIESGRANPALPGCAYGLERCSNRTEAPEPLTPAAVRAIRSAGAAPRESSGLRTVAAIALRFGTGATSYLLFKESTRKPPEIVLRSDIANVRDIEAINRKLEEIDGEVRRSIAELESGASLQATSLATIRQRVHELTDLIRRESDAATERDRELARGLVSLTEETMGLKTPMGDILQRLDELLDRPRPKTTPEPTAGRDEPTSKPPPDEENPKLRAQVDEFVKQLGDRAASDQTRYNAAVQLGDLGHPSAVGPLVQALQKDSYDLVRRAAAFSLGMLGKHAVSAIPILIEGVSEQEEYVGYMCARALGEIAKATLGQTVEFGYDPTMSRKQRRDVREQWEGWWQKNKALVESS